MKTDETALVLFSGGQDSTTCLHWALSQFNHVIAIGFDYGQKHKVELEQAAKIADRASVPFKVFNVQGLLTGGALVNHEQDVSAESHLDEDLPASFTAGRNILFLTIAASFARENDIHHLVTGVCQTDYSGYPDCRNNFVQAMRTALALGLDDDRLEIWTPLMWLTKAETWRLAKELNCVDVVVELSHTDYNGNRDEKHDWGYGRLDNPASVIRAKGYEEAKAKGWI